jgi:hypothetical protein
LEWWQSCCEVEGRRLVKAPPAAPWRAVPDIENRPDEDDRGSLFIVGRSSYEEPDEKHPTMNSRKDTEMQPL